MLTCLRFSPHGQYANRFAHPLPDLHFNPCVGVHREGPGTRLLLPCCSDPASREIAKSLYMLFGGIDLDPSDRLLGMYLVSEQQSWRRQRHALRALEATGGPAPDLLQAAGMLTLLAAAMLSIAHAIPRVYGCALHAGLPSKVSVLPRYKGLNLSRNERALPQGL